MNASVGFHPFSQFSTTLNSNHIFTLWLITHVSSALSLLGSLFIINSHLAFPKLRQVGHSHLIFWLSVADFGSSAMYAFIPVWHNSDPSLCVLQGAFIQYFQVASFFWTGSIAIALWLIFVKRMFDLHHFYLYFHIVAWGCALIDVVIGLAFHWFGDANYTHQHFAPSSPSSSEGASWCWIKVEKHWVKFGLYYFPFFFIWIANSIIYFQVMRKIKKMVPAGDLRTRATLRIRLYLLVFAFCIGVGVINRVVSWITEREYFWLSILDAAVSPLQGFLNCFVYGMNKNLRMYWIGFLTCQKPAELEALIATRAKEDDQVVIQD